MKRTSKNRPFFARYLAEQELATAAGGCGGSSQQPEPSPEPVDPGPIFTTLKAGKCGNDCDSDVDILPGV